MKHTLSLFDGRAGYDRLLEYHKGAERPTAQLWVYDTANALINFSGYTFSLKIGERGTTALLTKSSSIAGAAGSGTEPSGTPNIVVTWSAGDLALDPGDYVWQLTATSASLDYLFEGTFRILGLVA